MGLLPDNVSTLEALLLNAPSSGRLHTLSLALRELNAVKPEGGARIVEVGTSWNPKPFARFNAGWATRVFAWYAAQTGGTLTSIDSDRDATEAARRILDGLPATFVVGDGIHALGEITTPIDLLYMDGPQDGSFHLNAAQSLTRWPTLILFDDVRHEPYGVKGQYAVPWLMEQGYTLVFIRREFGGQLLLKREDA